MADSLFPISQSIMQFLNSNDYQYTLGSDIFVAPVLSSSSNNVLINNFPGTGVTWVYLFDNSQTFQSGTSTIINSPLDQYPVFIKSTSPLLALLDSVVNSVTGIEAIAAQKQPVLIYPNPAKDEIWVSGLTFKGTDEYEFRLFDALGRNLLRTKLTGGTTNVSVEGLENGIYYYGIKAIGSSAAEEISGNVVIQK
jgi:hypothetical protein